MIRKAFTLTELLVALGVGMIVLNAAFVVFINTAKFFKRIESVSTKNDIAESMIMWSLTQRDLSKYPQTLDLAPDKRPIAPDGDGYSGALHPQLSAAEYQSIPQFRTLGASHLVIASPAATANCGYISIGIRELSNFTYNNGLGVWTEGTAAKPVIQPLYLVVPATGD